MNKKFWIILIGIIILIVVVCFLFINPKTHTKDYALEPIIVYKTKADYYNFVFIRGIPDPNSPIPYPTKLLDDYLLGRGILEYGVRTAYVVNFTREEYSKLTTDQVLAIGFFDDYILDTDPFTEIYQCNMIPGNLIEYNDTKSQADNSIDTLNYVIANNLLDKYCEKYKWYG